MRPDVGLVAFTLNGDSVAHVPAPTERLSQSLRTAFGLTGTKVGCDAGDCGACTVLLDGDPICACLTATAQVQGRHVRTVEGLADTNTLSALQSSFLRHGAAQCGICTPGMLMSAAALLEHNRAPSRAEVDDALGGVLCRCTGYSKIVDAVLHAHDPVGEPPRPGAGEAVGSPIERLDGVDKVTGHDRFGADGIPDDALYLKVIRSPHHHATFEIGDTAAFLNDHDGLVAVLTARDVPGRNCHGVIPPFADQPVFAEKRALFRGEPVAVVAGEREAIERLDPEVFPITWAPLDPVFDPAEAVMDGAPLVHESRPNNHLTSGLVQRGDVETALPASDHRVEIAIATPFIEHAYIEPEAGFARRVRDRIEIHATTQAPHMDREAVAEIIGLDPEQVRVIPSACGGGFGSKLDLSVQPYIALAAWVLGRPAAIVYSRGESMRTTTKRHPAEITITVGCDADGRLKAIDFHGVFNTGAYASWGPTVANRVPVHASGPYSVPHYRARSLAVHTNTAPAGAFRGFGVPQSAVAQECAFDELADKAGIDRLAFRRLNALDNGMPTVTGQVFASGIGIIACLDALKPAWERAQADAAARNADADGASLRHGVGIGTCWYGCGNTSLPNPSTILIGITADGRVVLHQGATDIGQGSNSVVTQIAADALGVPVHGIELVGGDTDLTPDAGKTSASRQTFVSGKAALLSGTALRRSILRHVNVSEDATISLDGPMLHVEDGGSVHDIDLARLEPDADGYVFSACETYDPPTEPLDENGQGSPYAVYGYGAQIVELTVDIDLGTVKLDRLTTAHDVGRAINPVLVEGQIEGGSTQGIGMALMEEYVPGATENLHDYLIPTFGDVPEFEHIIVEVPDAEGPYGAKGLGEHVLIPTAPAILNAIRDATGGRVRHLPATPERVRAAIVEAQADQ